MCVPQPRDHQVSGGGPVPGLVSGVTCNAAGSSVDWAEML